MGRNFNLVVTAGILALILRVYAAVSLPLDHDEVVYYIAANEYKVAIQTDSIERIPKVGFNIEHPALAKLVYGAVLAWLPYDHRYNDLSIDQVWTYYQSYTPLDETPDPFRLLILREVSAFFGMLQVILVALLSPLAGIMLAMHSLTVKYTSVIYLEALPALMATASVIFFDRAKAWFRSLETTSSRKSLTGILFLLGSAITLGLAAAAKYQYAIAGLAISIFALGIILQIKGRTMTRLGLLAIWGSLSLLVFVLANPYLWGDPLGKLAHSIQFNIDYSNGETVAAAGYPFYQPLIWLSKPVYAHPMIAIPRSGNEIPIQLDSVIFLLALTGLPRLWKRSPLIIIWLSSSLLFLLWWNTKWPQYGVLVTAPLCLSAGEGLHTLGDALHTFLVKVNSRRLKRKGYSV